MAREACASCAFHASALHQEIRKQERRRAKSLPVVMENVDRFKQLIATCAHCTRTEVLGAH